MKSISAKLIILLIVAVLIPSSLYGILSIWTSRHYNFKVVTEGNINVAKRAAEEIDLYVTNSMAILNALAQNLGRFSIPEVEQQLILSNYVLNFQQFQQIYITDRRGKEILSTGNNLLQDRSKDAAYRIAIKGSIYKSDVFISRNLTPSMTIALPIKRLNMVSGVAIAEINLISMWNLVDSIRIGEGSYAYVVSGDGRLIAHGLGNGKVRVLSNENVKSLGIVSDVLTGKYTNDIYRNIEGEKVIGVAATIPSLGWGIVIEEPLSVAYASARRMTVFLGIMIVFFIIAAAILGYKGGSRYIIEPIHALIGATRRIGRGDLEEKVNIMSGDEFQEVGDAFNNMISQLKMLQEDIKRNERIAFMSKIAAGLVHDLRHPVRNIENYSRLIMKKYDDEDFRETFNYTVIKQFGNINRFLDDLLNLARPIHITPISLRICAEIKDIIDSFKEEVEKKRIGIETLFSDENIMVKVDKFSIGRVFNNIIKNAIEAMTDGGTLRISVKSTHDSVDIEFRDTGPGIPADKIDNIFTEFGTTKSRGVGLGLVITKRIIDAHNGTINIDSEVGKGTAVIIKLPLIRLIALL